MELNALHAFVAVAESGSFSSAANQLHLSQPAVSKRIAGLEQQLDTQLFDRIGKSTQLTEPGRILLPKAVAILSEVEESKKLLQNLAGKVAGTLKLGTSHHIGLHRLPPVLEVFHRSHPSVTMDIDFTDSELACDAVLHGDIEMAIVTLPSEPDRLLHIRPVWRDPLEFVCSCSHPLASLRNPISLETLASHEALLPSAATATRNIIEEAFGNHEASLLIGMETNYLETLKMMATVGLGWSALPAVMIGKELCTLDVPDVSIERQLGIVTHRNRTLSNAAEAFLALVLDS